MAGKVLNIKVFIPFKLRSGLTKKYHAICHYSYNLPLYNISQKRKMTPEIAKNIGIKKALQSATIGILIAFLFMMLLAGGNPQWMTEWNYWINIIIGIGIFYGLAYWFGKNAGYEILIKKKDSDKVGAKYGFLTLIITAFLVGWTGFMQEGMEPYDTFWDSFEDYIFKPFFWITVIGFLPAILVGILFGKWIKKNK
tara:strand:+ start:5929 stop:6516 length:588 start_codon:yes stop_codon:yes gene_type:complete